MTSAGSIAVGARETYREIVFSALDARGGGRTPHASVTARSYTT
jgi:hypothetical protein